MKFISMGAGSGVHNFMVPQQNRRAVKLHDCMPADSNFEKDIIQSLSTHPQSTLSKYFYDQRGSELFEQICELPEYYPTRTENHILQTYRQEITSYINENTVLIELGSGASKKTRILIENSKLSRYVGVDISKDFLLQSTQTIADSYPWLDVHAVHADFSEFLNLPDGCLGKQNLAFYPGSSIGNFNRKEAHRYLKQIHQLVGINGKLLIGIDLKKDPAILHAAYNDAKGITAAFNLNLLHRINRELDADINIEQFQHEAFYNEHEGRIEMHLVSTTNQKFTIAGNRFHMALGDSIHTENSYKYSLPEFKELADSANFKVEKVWHDQNSLFSEQLLRAV